MRGDDRIEEFAEHVGVARSREGIGRVPVASRSVSVRRLATELAAALVEEPLVVHGDFPQVLTNAGVVLADGRVHVIVRYFIRYSFR